MSRPKQKQTQKQEQNVKVVINQNDNKKKRRQRKKPQTQGPTPYGYTPAQQMRAYQTFTPQINNNAAADFSSVVNALRANMAMAMPVQQGPQLIRNPPIQAPPIQAPPIQPPPSPIQPPPSAPTLYTPAPPARQSIIPDFPAGRLDMSDFSPLRTLPQTESKKLAMPRGQFIDMGNLENLLKTPSKLKGSYKFDKPIESRATSMVPYNEPLPDLRSSIVFDNDEPVVRNVPFESLQPPQESPLPPSAQKNTIPRQGRKNFQVNISEPLQIGMEAGKDFPQENEIMGAKTNAGVQMKMTKYGVPDKRTAEYKQWLLAQQAEIVEEP